ncbi:reverse transcriptase [Vairimorpha apis BRL 01]|uniref:Reverse transcriptase n=1 Tax=Vairimorpha apis BRL 01 TaxID=1037528 RepID=T0MMS9_9MICR|nr:reverse transcriptase [Vairimorpha apis BRL 01]
MENLVEQLQNAKRSKLIKEIKTRFYYKKLIVWIKKEFSMCLHKLFFLQERNIFFNNSNIGNCLHLLFAENTILRHQEKANKFIEIQVDTTTITDVKIKYNKPNILKVDKKSKKILIVEIGVTSIDNLQQAETEKLRKYDLLANELDLTHWCKTRIIPYVLTWDGIVTKYHAKYRKALKITDRIEAYIQSVTLKKTLKSVSMEYRRGGDLILAENELNENLHTK